MTERYDYILEENAKLKSALQQSKHIIDRTKNDYETICQIYEDSKLTQDKFRKENEDLSIKCMKLIQDKKDLEAQFETTIRNLKSAIEQKQNEIEEQNIRMQPPLDLEMYRIKILNEIDIPHRQQLEERQQQVDKCSEKNYELQKEITVLQHQIKVIEDENQREIKLIKDRNQQINNQLKQEIFSLEQKQEQNDQSTILQKQKINIDQLNGQIQFLSQEIENLRQDRDNLREQLNQNLIQFSKQLQTERLDKRHIKTENDKYAIKMKFQEEEIQKYRFRYEQGQMKIEQLNRDNDILQDQIRDKDDTIHNLERKIHNVEDNFNEQANTNREDIQKQYNEFQTKILDERNKVTNIQRQYGNLQRVNQNVQDELREYKTNFESQNRRLKAENQQLESENLELQKYQRQAIEYQSKFDDLQRQTEHLKNKVQFADQNVNDQNQLQKLQQENAKLKQDKDNYKKKAIEERKKQQIAQYALTKDSLKNNPVISIGNYGQ